MHIVALGSPCAAPCSSATEIDSGLGFIASGCDEAALIHCSSATACAPQ